VLHSLHLRVYNCVLIVSLFKTLLLMSNGHPVTLLVFQKNEENLKKNSYFVFKFVDSIDHCSLTKYTIPLNFTLLDSSLQDSPFGV
jgi:hypothetical protein